MNGLSIIKKMCLRISSNSRTAVARNCFWPARSTPGRSLIRNQICIQIKTVCRRGWLFHGGCPRGLPNFPGRLSVTTICSSSASMSPPPAEIVATCLRCIITGISGDLAEELGDVLLTMGAQSVVVQEHRPPGAPEQEIFDDGEAHLWDRCDLLVHFPLEADVEGSLAMALDALGLDPGGAAGEGNSAVERQEEGTSVFGIQYHVEAVANEAWVEQIKASYVPLRVCEDLWIIPEWSEPVDLAATNIILQPGVAFGTGEHPTTRLCLRELRDMGARGKLLGATVCDYGTGSGVLALAALKYGAARAVGTDIDSLAVKAAQRNGALNGFQPHNFLALQCGGGIHEPDPLAVALNGESSPSSPHSSATSQFDLLVANILRGPLVELQPRLSRYVRPGGQLMLSGILYEQAEEIKMAYSREFEDFRVFTDEQWALLLATKKI
ncbi:hypothetical protein VaNZ11_015364 [Volvox africanus]|uniref:ETFB lysine methyltransferase n=1 Tax=Volvox africanus TaxID=51714 RepID=A0ABQ5SLA7_9CHLO|nr:hypothetical protein VaNZ11_015364 [Volvox africanus]